MKKALSEEKNSSGKLLKHSTIYAIGNISSQLVGFIMLPVYTRYLSPADYGVIGLLTFAVILMEGAFGARLAQAIPKYYYQQSTDAKRNAVISTALIISAAVSAVTSAIIFMTRDAGAAVLFGSTEFSLALGLYGLQLVISAIEGYGLTYIRILQKPILFVSLSLAKLTAQLSLNIWFVVHLEMGVMGVVYASITASIISATAIGLFTLARTGIRFDWPIGKQMLIFSWPLWFSGMAIFYVGASGRYYIRLFSSLSDVGLYELAAKFTAILGLIIWQPFSQFWDIERFKIYRQPDAQNTYQQFFSIICLLMAIGTLGISTFSGSVIKLMAGAEFHDASKAVPILTIGAMFSALATFFNFSFLVKEKTSWILRNNFIIAGVVTLLYVLMTPKLGFLGAAIALCVAQIVQFLWVFYASQRTYCMGISLTKALPAPILSAVLSIGVGSILWETDIATDIALRTLFFACCTALVAFCSPDFHHIKEKVYQYINNKEKLKKT